ncbi:uncharacterized protein LOC129600305 [Paramacrobiotus metropolitanus]|uniref:uncharacterized protein LOC129600305 n=1 Tax=Paramacrobiotus metropolitanus TaxID=2943436 RepID=UPI00244647E6|nr:uncharacterized protein LOC129600305 [Paramacrobiotus metropolitanus]
MATSTDRLAKFNPETMDYKAWKFLFDNYVALTDLHTDKHRPLLINSLDTKALQLLVSMCKPKMPSDFTLGELLAKLETAYAPYTNQITEWALFFSLRQGESESLVDFATRMRDKTILCDFPSTVLEKNLCAVLVAGIRSDATRRYLMLSELKTFDAALQLAIKFETSVKEAKKNNVEEESVNRIAKRDAKEKKDEKSERRKETKKGSDEEEESDEEGASRRKCKRCGSWRHTPDECWYRNTRCNHCGNKGHIERACQQKRNEERKKDKISTVFNVEEDYFDILP